VLRAGERQVDGVREHRDLVVVPPESLLEVRELYDSYFLNSTTWTDADPDGVGGDPERWP
jgi:hypothetical protein